MSQKARLVVFFTVFCMLVIPSISHATIHMISVDNSFFTPLGTVVQQGDTVRWTWVGGISHSTSSDAASPKFWDSGISAVAGFTYDIIFTTSDPVGAYPYHCSVHPAMVDTLFLVGPNSQVNPTPPSPQDQNNPSIALSEAVPGEVYAVYNDFLVPGAPGPTIVQWSFSPANGALGTWKDAPKAPDAPFVEEWNATVSAIPFGGGYTMVSSQRAAGPPFSGVANGIVANVSPGGGVPFGAPMFLMGNVPGLGGTWHDYPVVEIDDDIFASASPGDAHFVWVEYTDGNGGDVDGNGNPYDEPGDFFTIWYSASDVGGGAGAAPAYPGFVAPVPITPITPVTPTSLPSARPAIDIVRGPGTPLIPAGGVYVAHLDAAAGVVFLDASPLPSGGAPFGALTGGFGPLPIAPFVPLPPVSAPAGVNFSNSVTVAVDDGTLCPGAVYVAYTDYTLGDADILFISSFDGGLTWTPPVRVNSDLLGNGLDQWAPHMRFDPGTNEIQITFYDRRNDPANFLQETWTAVSTDCGVSWKDCVISDAGSTPPISNTPLTPAFFIGDYLGSDINALNGRIAIWNDGRDGADQDIFSQNSSVWYFDGDGDGLGDPATAIVSLCNPGGYVLVGGDCDDTDPAIGLPTTWYADSDGDGFGDLAVSIVACTPPPGYVADSTDCDDTNNSVYPGAYDLCDGIDNDCDGITDNGDADGDGIEVCIDCDDTDPSIGVASTWYVDTDGDGFGDLAVSVVACTAPPGYVADNTDCDDTNSAVYPGAFDLCDGLDNDCDGITDNGDADGDGITVCVDCDDTDAGIGAPLTWYADSDGDGYGDPSTSTTACTAPSGYVSDNTDCDDTNAGINPGATEIPGNGIDEDCDGFDGAGCCIAPIRGNVDYDVGDIIDIADLVYFVDYSFGSPPGPAPPCFEEADVDTSLSLDIADIVYLVNYMFSGGPAPDPC